MSVKVSQSEYLDHLTIMDCLRWHAAGYEFTINDGHVTGVSPIKRKPEGVIFVDTPTKSRIIKIYGGGETT